MNMCFKGKEIDQISAMASPKQKITTAQQQEQNGGREVGGGDGRGVMVRITMNIATQKMQHVQIRQSPYHPLPPTGLITVPLIPSHFQHEPNELTCGTHVQNGCRELFSPCRLQSCCIQQALMQMQC